MVLVLPVVSVTVPALRPVPLPVALALPPALVPERLLARLLLVGPQNANA